MNFSQSPLMFKPDVGCMPSLWKHQNSGENAVSPYCAVDSAQEDVKVPCKIAKTVFEVFVMKPYPEVLMLNINWFSDHISYMETFAFGISIATEFKIN